jgi:hypothetical protein
VQHVFFSNAHRARPGRPGYVRRCKSSARANLDARKRPRHALNQGLTRKGGARCPRGVPAERSGGTSRRPRAPWFRPPGIPGLPHQRKTAEPWWGHGGALFLIHTSKGRRLALLYGYAQLRARPQRQGADHWFVSGRRGMHWRSVLNPTSPNRRLADLRSINDVPTPHFTPV